MTHPKRMDGELLNPCDHWQVEPIGDLIAHEGEDCPCGPTSELVPTDHGDEWIVVHHALDGRP